MTERLSDNLKLYLQSAVGRDVNLRDIRAFLKIEPGSKDDQNLRVLMSVNFVAQKIVKPSGRNDGIYKVLTPTHAVRVFRPDRVDIPPFRLCFPRDFHTGEEMPFAEHIVVREGDIILIAGMSNYFKTGLCLNFLGENIDQHPVLMGNEYTIMTEVTPEHPSPFDVSPRFYERLKVMSTQNTESGGWVNWVDEQGNDKFTLLPVWADYAEHIIRDRISIIDWINLPGEYYMISPIMEGIKKAIGRGIGILVIQKAEGVTHGRGGAMSREFADVEILLDKLGNDEVLLTLGKVKEATKALIGKTYAFIPSRGVNILNFREVKSCPACKGTGYTKQEKCSMCWGTKFVDGEK